MTLKDLIFNAFSPTQLLSMCCALSNKCSLSSSQAQLPTLPKIEFSPVQAWNSGKTWRTSPQTIGFFVSCGRIDNYMILILVYFIAGVRWTISALSEAPTKAAEYSNQGVQYLKDLTK